MASLSRTTTLPLKESTRDMLRLMAYDHLSEEEFWEVFNQRVILNKPVDLNRMREY